MGLGPDKVALLALAVCAVGVGLLWGRATLPPSESEAISRVAARYSAETGGQAGDCYARPGPEAGIWLTVFCEGAAGRFAYPLDRRGRAVDVVDGGT